MSGRGRKMKGLTWDSPNSDGSLEHCLCEAFSARRSVLKGLTGIGHPASESVHAVSRSVPVCPKSVPICPGIVAPGPPVLPSLSNTSPPPCPRRHTHTFRQSAPACPPPGSPPIRQGSKPGYTLPMPDKRFTRFSGTIFRSATRGHGALWRFPAPSSSRCHIRPSARSPPPAHRPGPDHRHRR